MGTVRIIHENNKYFLELDQDFSASEIGPDLHVILHRSNDVLGSSEPPFYSLQAQDLVILDRLQAFIGAQRYAIPDDVNLAEFPSAVIWCREFNATFGAAKLNA